MSDSFPSEASEESCAVCGKATGGLRGYSHVRYEERIYALCCPLCLETFEKRPGYYAAIRIATEAVRPLPKREAES